MHIKSLLFFAVALCLSLTTGIAKATQIENISLPSKLLDTDVLISVSLPKGYDPKQANYATLYLMDGQWLMTHALSIRTDLTERNGPKKTPDFIIIGIQTPNDKRWDWAMDDNEKWIAFLERELIVEIEKRYSAKGARLYAGWEMTGGAVIKTLAKSPHLFDGYIAASPTPLFGTYFPQLDTENTFLATSLAKIKNDSKFLFIGEAEDDYPAQYGIENLLSILKANSTKSLQWHHVEYAGVAHPESAYFTLNGAVRKYFEHWGPLEFTSIAQFKALGGISYVHEYYKSRAAKLGLETDQDAKHFTRRNLTLLAIGENNIEVFHQLMTTFAPDNFIEKSFVPHLNAYIQFYLQHRMLNEAEAIAHHLILKHPDRAMAQHALGDVMYAKSEHKAALKHYKNAVQLAKQNNDWMLEVYKKDLLKVE